MLREREIPSKHYRRRVISRRISAAASRLSLVGASGRGGSLPGLLLAELALPRLKKFQLPLFGVSSASAGSAWASSVRSLIIESSADVSSIVALSLGATGR